jgi:TonB family protein
MILRIALDGRHCPGAVFSIRTRFLDDALLAAVCASSFTQVVILAAGLDSRAFRLAWPEGLVLFEVDRDDVFNHKETVLERLRAQPRCQRRVVRTEREFRPDGTFPLVRCLTCARGESMMVGSILLVGLSLALAAQSATPPTQAAPQQSPCAQALVDAGAGEICAGDQAAWLANAAPKESAERTRQLEVAAEHYRKAVLLTSKVATKILALNLLADSYDVQRLNDPRQRETALRELIRLTPNDLAPVYRLSKFQEDQGFIDAAEETLLGARHQQPDAVESYTMLAQFYSRRAIAKQRETDPQFAKQAEKPQLAPYENGVYRAGGAVPLPTKLSDMAAKYPPEALASGVQGVVILEVTINESGNVTDPKLLRSIPLLDEAALEAVRQWQFSPSVVNGHVVPVKMTVTVNFTPPPRR